MSLFDSASLVVTPNGTKASKLYAIKPTDASGDLSVTRATTATRVNSAGLIESVSSNVPRLDYTNSTCPSILVEPQRTNLALYSEQFDNANWIKGQTTVTVNSTISPDGNTTADTIFEAATTNTHNIASNYLINFVSGTSYTISIYAKNNTSGRGLLQIAGYALGSGASNIYANFNLSNGTLGSVSGGTSTITAAANGFYRLTFSFTCGNTISERINYSLITSSTSTAFQSYLGDSSKGVILWGAQLEAGSYATSYVPTQASSVTRNADLTNKTGISSLIGQTEGTLYGEFRLQTATGGSAYLGLTSGSFSNFILLGKEAPNKLVFGIRANGSNIIFNSSTALTSDYVKCAIAYKSGSWAAYLNGNLMFSGTNTFTFSAALNTLGFGSTGDFASLNDKIEIKSTAIFKTRLTNDELAQLTTI